MIPQEMMYANGWGHDVRMEGIAKRVIEEIAPTEERTVKRRKGKLPMYGPRLSEAAGNAVVLPDMASFLVPLMLVLRAGQFAHGHFSLEELLAVLGAQAAESSSRFMELTEDISEKALKDLANEDDGPEQPGDDGLAVLDDDLD